MKIKPCPFCGNTNLFVGDADTIRNDGDHEYFAVCCSVTQGGCGATSGYYPYKTKAIKKWNKRCTDK